MTVQPSQPARNGTGARRLCFATLVALTTFVLAWDAFSMLRINGLNPLKVAIFVLFVLLLLPMTLSFWTATFGFLVRLRGRDSLAVTSTLDQAPAQFADLPPTAVVVPAYNEDPVRLIAGLKSTYESLAQTPFLSKFDFFLLSDTTNPDIWVREELAFSELQATVSHPERLHYRNRRENLERKTGNIADFCATWGDRYRYMIVFDADSIITGNSLVDMVRLMEENPTVGIVQAPPLPVNRRTLFGRLQQFATHAYSAIFITGLNFWQGGAGNYWGHNAIIRIRPFVEHCRLPKLSGPEPLGGAILSHDFVEAAFMRRAGWKVYLASDLGGSYEETPPSLILHAIRDRRWCQGNLQHSRLLLTPGLHFINRLHLGMGVMAYLSSPLWMLLLLLSTIEGLRETLTKHPYFPGGRSLFPTWRISVEHDALALFCAIMALMILPKLFSLVLHVRDRARAAGFGGRAKLAGSVVLETLSSALLAPVLGLLQTQFVVGILLGKKVTWETQDRGDAGTSFREAWRRHWAATLVGVIWAALLGFAAPKLFWWFSPVFLGLLLVVPVSVWSSRVAAGEWAREHGWFLTPEEVHPPEILQRLEQNLKAAKTHPWAASHDGLSWVLEDSSVCDVHLRLLLPPPEAADPLRTHYLEGLRLKVVHVGLEALTTREKRDLLLDPDSVRALRTEPLPVARAAG